MCLTILLVCPWCLPFDIFTHRSGNLTPLIIPNLLTRPKSRNIKFTTFSSTKACLSLPSASILPLLSRQSLSAGPPSKFTTPSNADPLYFEGFTTVINLFLPILRSTPCKV